MGVYLAFIFVGIILTQTKNEACIPAGLDDVSSYLEMTASFFANRLADS